MLMAAQEASDTRSVAMVSGDDGPDDTFEVGGGIAEVVTLVVTQDQRSTGVGQALLAAAEDIARDRGFDTVKIAVPLSVSVVPPLFTVRAVVLMVSGLLLLF